MKKSVLLKNSMSALLLVILVVIDQVTKYFARGNLKEVGSIPVIDNFFHLTYVENRGAAFGMLQGKYFFFVIMTIFAIVILTKYYISQKEKNSKHLKILSIVSIMIIAGAIGNLIDRMFFGFVTDMIDVKGVWEFVFNVADIYVVCGTILLGMYIVLYDKEHN